MQLFFVKNARLIIIGGQAFGAIFALWFNSQHDREHVDQSDLGAICDLALNWLVFSFCQKVNSFDREHCVKVILAPSVLQY